MTTAPDNSSRFLNSVNLVVPTMSCHQKVLIDSGAHTNFVDKGLVREFGLGLVPLERPLHVTSLDGRPLWQITHRITLVSIVFSNGHPEFLTFLSTPPNCSPLFWIIMVKKT